MKDGDNESRRERWARFRFSVIGPLLAAPPGKCELRSELEKLASRDYRHPITGVPTRFGLSTIERWYYQAREAQDPVDELKNRRRKDAGEHPSLGLRLRPALLHGPEQIADLPVPVAESPGAVRIGHPERGHLVEYLAPNSVFNSLPRQRSSPHLRPDDRLVTIDRVLHHASLGVA